VMCGQQFVVIRWRAVGNRDDGSEESEEVITKSRM